MKKPKHKKISTPTTGFREQGKVLMRVDTKTQIYVDASSTPEERILIAQRWKEKHQQQTT